MIKDGDHRGLGPRPAAPGQDPATQMSRARASVLEQLGRHNEPTTVTALAAECGQHTNTVREHLDALAAAGLVLRTSGKAQGRGRPAIRYAVAPPEISRPQLREYASLAIALAAHLERTSPDPRGFALEAGRHWGNEVASKLASSDAPAAGSSRELLEQLGFDPEPPEESTWLPVRSTTGTTAPEAHAVAEARGESAEVERVRLRQCPLLDAARRHPDVVCQVHLGAVLGRYEARGESTVGVRLEPFAEPGACLIYLPRHVERHHP
ncbi:helix-turn-helix transcriptional regulator [Gephyromycinifex aptenodytis]|uniref:helix-turn-helix transcriptional regulator n=1 Tax=Gephyromycinifex aptenodytis TaxID=2716227 RepID=UPI001B2FF023|nr:helix-turn-helix domain-containing protein [Gephyromycinifex aptenodytis]